MKSLLEKYDFFLLDLDNTLYPEIKYLDQAYSNIAEFLSKKYNILADDIYQFLITTFKDKGRENLFDKMFVLFEIDFKEMQNILNILRTFEPQSKIYIYSRMQRILPKLVHNSKEIFVVTNGNPIQQKNKVKNIEWSYLKKYFTFVYANEYIKKPSIKSFDFIRGGRVMNQTNTIMIGDSIVDQQYANNCNIDFMMVDKFYTEFE